jgi:RNA polymerase sigma factor (sigma-70 family)
LRGVVSAWGDLERLYSVHSASVRRRARQLLGDDEAARDATQEVFMRVMRAGGSVPVEPTPTAWLYRVTTNLCLNRLRDKKRRDHLLGSRAPETSVQPTSEMRAIVTEILSRVPEELQDVALYFFLDELTYDEIARLLGVSKRTVSNRLLAFRELMGRLFPEHKLAS